MIDTAIETRYNEVAERHAQSVNALRMLEEQLTNMRHECSYLKGAKDALESLRQPEPVPYAPVMKDDMPMPADEVPAKRSHGRIRTPE